MSVCGRGMGGGCRIAERGEKKVRWVSFSFW